MMGFLPEEARELLGTRVRPRWDPVPAASCGRVVGAEPAAAGGWVLIVAGRIRGIEVLLRCSREDWALLEVDRWTNA